MERQTIVLERPEERTIQQPQPIEPTFKIDLPSKGKLDYPETLTFRPLKVKELKVLASSPSDKTYLENLVKVLQAVNMDNGVSIQSLTFQDFIACLIGVRINSIDKDFEVLLTCPACKKVVTKHIDLNTLESKPLPDDFTEPYEIDGYKIRLPRVKDSITSLLEEDIYELIRHSVGLSVKEFDEIPASTFRKFAEWIADNDYGINLEQTATCLCGEVITFSIPFRKEFFI